MFQFCRCSPHVAHWQIEFPSALRNLPVCHEFCNDWFTACASDLTCVSNWISDWATPVINGVNMCPQNSTCTSFT